jgi:hypothetical protein
MGDIPIMYPIPIPGNPWGVLVPLVGTSWEQILPRAKEEEVDRALRGYVLPLMRRLGTSPGLRGRRLPLLDARCFEWRVCGGFTAMCRPGHPVPACYTAPLEDLAQREAATVVARAWADGRHVFVMEDMRNDSP